MSALPPEQMLQVAPGLHVVDPAAFRAFPVDFLRLVLAPVSHAELAGDDTDSYAGHALAPLPPDVSLAIVRAVDARGDVALGEWTLGASALRERVPLFMKGEERWEIEDAGYVDAVVVARKPDGSLLYWGWPAGRDGRVHRYNPVGFYQWLSGTFGNEMLGEYRMLVDKLVMLANAVRTETNPVLQLPAPFIGDVDSSLQYVVQMCGRIRAPLDALCAMPRWLCAGSLASAFRALFDRIDARRLAEFLEEGAGYAAQDATKPKGQPRRAREDLVNVWRVTFAFEALGAAAAAAAFANARAQWELVLDVRTREEKGAGAAREWRRAQPWE